MKKWVLRMRIGVGVALVVLGVVLWVVGWVWPFSASNVKTVEYGTSRPQELHGVRDSWALNAWVLPWQCITNVESIRTSGFAPFDSGAEDERTDELSVRRIPPVQLEVVHSTPYRFRFSAIDDWSIGPLFIKNEPLTAMTAMTIRSFAIGFPPWLLPLVGLGVAWAPLRQSRTLHRRERRGLCAGCGYESKGLAVCPECGKAGA